MDSQAKYPVVLKVMGRTGNELQNAPQISEENQPQKSKQKTRWSDAANLLLISGWLNTSKDYVVGIDQTTTRFWDRIADYFNENRKDGSSRTGSQCKDHWNKINPKVLLFNGCYQRVQRARHTGWSDDQIMYDAHQLYKSENCGSHFLFDYCWKLLKDEPKWNTSYQQKGFKKTKVSESGAYTSSSNLEKSDDEVHEVRPIGQKAAKKKGKGKEKNEKKWESVEYLKIQTRKVVAFEKLVEIKARKAEDKRITKYMDYLIMDTSYMTDQQKKDHEKFCDHIKTNILKF